MSVKNKLTYTFYLLLILFVPQFLMAQTKIGTPILFNDGWVFHKGDITVAPADVAWNAVQIPHDWSIAEPFSEDWASATGYLPGGIGWYKKTFTANKSWASKQVYICFDGVYKNSEVWLNGHLLGKRPNGFIPFQYDLSPYLNFKGKNTLTVKVDHTEFADSRWYTGSGIYRNVYLVVKNPVHIGLWDIAFTTPEVSTAKAVIKVQATVTNSANAVANVHVKVNLLDAAGKVVAVGDKNIVAKKGKQDVVFNSEIFSPKLWCVEHPDLYQLRVSVYRNDKLIDEVSQHVGIRSIRFDKDKGFFLNEKNTKIKGVCIHDDAGALGVAVPEEVWVRRLKTLKDAGVNAIRLSHNPHADYLYDLLDQMGFLVMDEAFDEWDIGKNKWVKGWNVGTPSKDGYHEYFKEWADRDLADMILRSRNHPSIIMWSIGNEIDYPNDPYSNEVLNTGVNPQIYGKGYLPDHPAATGLTVIAKQLVKTVKATDQSRPVTAALAGVVMSNEIGYPEVLDIVGYNYQEYRYQEDHKKYPNRVIYGSENGMRKQAWDAVDTNAYISAQFLWTGIDYMGEAGKWPQRSNGAGLLDLAGFKKPEYYFRQSLWADKPMVYIAAREMVMGADSNARGHRAFEPVWNWQAGSKTRIICFTNCQETELFLNGKSLGRKSRSGARDQIPSWDVDYQPAKLLVKGYNNDVEVCSNVINTSGEASQIKLTVTQTSFKLNKKGLGQIEIQVTDANGIPVFNYSDELNVKINGPAKLLGLESGSLSSHESYQADTRSALHGKLLAYVQTLGTAGKAEVTVSGKNLKPTTISLTIQ